MAIQKQVNLNEPLDANAKPTLSRTSLTPELAEASLTLHGDYYRQLQGKLNRHIFWHPISVIFVLGASLGFLTYRLWDYISLSSGFSDFVDYALNDRGFKIELTSVFPALILTFGVIGLSSYFLSDDFRTISDNLKETDYLEKIYGFDLKKFAKLTESKFIKEKKKISPKEAALIRQGENTIMMMYKDSPIAIITLVPIVDKSTETHFYVKITGLHVRKVFAKVDFSGLLLEWSIIKSRELYQKFTNNKTNVDGCKITIYAEGYSFDRDLISTLREKSFGLLSESYWLNPFINNKKHSMLTTVLFLTNKVFGVARQTYGITLLTKNGDDDLILQAARESELLGDKKKQS